jgi:HEAT repeat protein
VVTKKMSFVASLIQQLENSQLTVRIHAGILLAGMGTQARPAVHALTELLSSDAVQDRRLAAMTLGALADDISETLPLLRNARRDNDATVRRFAAQAVEEIDRTGRQRKVA